MREIIVILPNRPGAFGEMADLLVSNLPGSGSSGTGN